MLNSKCTKKNKGGLTDADWLAINGTENFQQRAAFHKYINGRMNNGCCLRSERFCLPNMGAKIFGKHKSIKFLGPWGEGEGLSISRVPSGNSISPSRKYRVLATQRCSDFQQKLFEWLTQLRNKPHTSLLSTMLCKNRKTKGAEQPKIANETNTQAYVAKWPSCKKTNEKNSTIFCNFKRFSTNTQQRICWTP